ncbi:MAG: zinc ribbon domain-containing protein [Actinobacteria bacterium]|nr:zinc ribbon domain-containing protein [Actinomycetota bacterium]
MGALAVFGISNDGLNLAVKLLLLILIAIWLALVFWTYADARRRVADQMLVTCAAAGSFFFPFVGAVVYMIVRPPEYLDDVRERELEIAAAEARLSQVEHQACPKCGTEIEKSYLRCPNCARKLKEPCVSCGRPLDPRWRLCPYCEAETPRRATAEEEPRRRPTRRATRPATQPAQERSAPRASRETREAAAGPRAGNADRPRAAPSERSRAAQAERTRSSQAERSRSTQGERSRPASPEQRQNAGAADRQPDEQRTVTRTRSRSSDGRDGSDAA